MKLLVNFSIFPSCFSEWPSFGVKENKILYQLHGFFDASNSALFCVMCLRRMVKSSRSCISLI